MSETRSSVDVYPVGLFRDLKHRRYRGGRRYLLGQVRCHNWRAVRNYFNGYLAEHATEPVNAGHGWTRRRALADLDRILGGSQ